MMPTSTAHPTPYHDLNDVLHELVVSVQEILGDSFTGAYLHGSFAVGDYDADSDVEIRATMRGWAEQIFADPQQMNNRWYQPFAVLSYCRMLHTLQIGTVESKLAGAEWGKAALDSRWAGLIQRVVRAAESIAKSSAAGRRADFRDTLEFIRYALAVAAGYSP